jgi:uncharacterized protein (DUF433 family)
MRLIKVLMIVAAIIYIVAFLDWRDYIVSDPNLCHGQACIKGTRIPVAVILDNLAAGVSETELLQSYPTLTPEAIRAALAYAAELAREQLLPLTG